MKQSLLSGRREPLPALAEARLAANTVGAFTLVPGMKHPCDLWVGPTVGGTGAPWGRGAFLWTDKTGNRLVVPAAEAAWRLWHGRSVPKGKLVAHHCDVESCVNPRHLHLADPALNAGELAARGAARGRHAKLVTLAHLHLVRTNGGQKMRPWLVRAAARLGLPLAWADGTPRYKAAA